MSQQPELEYAGFWRRVGAQLIDGVLLAMVQLPLLYAIYGGAYFESQAMLEGPADFLISVALPAIAIILFWVYRGATPGKMVMGVWIVDAATGNRVTVGQCIGRYLGYFVSAIVFGLGYLWVAFDARRQGWHDKLAGTVVIREVPSATRPVHFPDAG